MSDPLTWSINLGRWVGVPVRVHVTLIAFAAWKLLWATVFDRDGEIAVGETAGWLGLLVLALAAHELGHALAAIRLGVEPEEVRLWPLGNLVGPRPVPITRSREAFLVAVAGPVTSLVLASAVGVGLLFADAQMVVNPFGRGGTGDGAPTVDGVAAGLTQAIWWIGWFGYLNWVIALANLIIPALPMDAGRALRAWLAKPSLSTSRDGLIAPWTARTFAVILGLAGLVRIFFQEGTGGFELLGLALLCEVMVRRESWMFEEGGEYEDSLFGYDFSAGYTSLEGSGPKVRPYRESALARWRRRRSEARRHRRAAREAAEERRMDEILAKVHAEGRDAMTAEEHRFLVRVSQKYRNRPKSRERAGP